MTTKARPCQAKDPVTCPVHGKVTGATTHKRVFFAKKSTPQQVSKAFQRNGWTTEISNEALVEIASGIDSDFIKSDAEAVLSSRGYSYPETLTARYFGFDNVVKNSDSGDFADTGVIAIHHTAERIASDYNVKFSSDEVLESSKKFLLINDINVHNRDDLDFHDVSRFGATAFVKDLVAKAESKKK